MKNILIIRNRDIKRVLIGIPKGHKHYRCVIELKAGQTLVLQEASIANIVRAYVIVKTHPQKRAIELQCKELKNKKPGFAEYQLLETERTEEEIQEELGKIIS
jgi:hypothetical protein